MTLKINGKTGLCCLIGDPVDHSVSPAMHNAAYNAADLNHVYLAFRIRKNALNITLKGLKALNVKGINITIPHKVTVMPLLDELDKKAQMIGAVNTIVNEDGRLRGYNTDGVGALKALKEEKIKGKNIVILGAGGAARAIAYTLTKRCTKLVLLNRTRDKARKLAEEIGGKSESKVLWGGLNEAKPFIEDCDVIINATSVGMYHNTTPIKANLLKRGMTVFDIIYNPMETKLLRDAKASGAEIIGGLEMLIEQGAESIRLWFNIEPEIDLMQKAALKALKTRGVSS